MHLIPGTNIYIGNREDIRYFKEKGITAILNVATDVHDPVPPSHSVGAIIEMGDVHNAPVMVKVGCWDQSHPRNPIYLATHMLDYLLGTGHVVLIHCFMGHNRAPRIVAELLSKKNGTSWQEEFKRIEAVRPEVYTKPWMDDTHTFC